MHTVSQTLLKTFDQLPHALQWQVASEILRRTVQFDFPPLSDNELLIHTEIVFLALDANEAEGEQTLTR